MKNEQTTTKSTTAKTTKTTTPKVPRDVNRENIEGLVEEAREHLQRAVMAFVLVEGAEDGFYGRTRDELRSQFNEAVHTLHRDLVAILDETQAVAS